MHCVPPRPQVFRATIRWTYKRGDNNPHYIPKHVGAECKSEIKYSVKSPRKQDRKAPELGLGLSSLMCPMFFHLLPSMMRCSFLSVYRIMVRGRSSCIYMYVWSGEIEEIQRLVLRIPGAIRSCFRGLVTLYLISLLHRITESPMRT